LLAEEQENKKAKSKPKAKKESDPVNDAGNSAIRVEMDIIKPDFAGMTWNIWKDTHAEVSMAMSLCALMYTLMHVTACMFRQINLQRLCIVGVYAGCQQMHQGTTASLQGQPTD